VQYQSKILNLREIKTNEEDVNGLNKPIKRFFSTSKAKIVSLNNTAIREFFDDNCGKLDNATKANAAALRCQPILLKLMNDKKQPQRSKEHMSFIASKEGVKNSV
jgi:hypothetical protein